MRAVAAVSTVLLGLLCLLVPVMLMLHGPYDIGAIAVSAAMGVIGATTIGVAGRMLGPPRS